MADSPNFGFLFKKYRLASGFATMREFGEELAARGFVFEDSLFSHWQKNRRIPKEKKLLLAIIKIFIEKEGINSTQKINEFLAAAGWGYITPEENNYLMGKKPVFVKKTIKPKKLLEFLNQTAKSKKLLRTGWIREKIKDPESVAEHSFQLSVIAMVLADQFNLDKEKLIKMAVLHDLAEVITGDLVYARGKIMDLEKLKRKEEAELQGIKKMFRIIGKEGEFGRLFEEMLEKKTPEAKIFWQLDKLEMVIQALNYEKSQNKSLDEFFVISRIQIQNPYLFGVLKEIIKARP